MIVSLIKLYEFDGLNLSNIFCANVKLISLCYILLVLVTVTYAVLNFVVIILLCLHWGKVCLFSVPVQTKHSLMSAVTCVKLYCV